MTLWKEAPYPGETVPPILIKIDSYFPVWMDNQRLTDIWGKWKGKIMTQEHEYVQEENIKNSIVSPGQITMILSVKTW